VRLHATRMECRRLQQRRGDSKRLHARPLADPTPTGVRIHRTPRRLTCDARLLPLMARPVWMVSVCVPARLRDRLARLRVHRRQPLYELIEEALDAAVEARPP